VFGIHVETTDMSKRILAAKKFSEFRPRIIAYSAGGDVSTKCSGALSRLCRTIYAQRRFRRGARERSFLSTSWRKQHCSFMPRQSSGPQKEAHNLRQQRWCYLLIP
jgi:hypothetical protein